MARIQACTVISAAVLLLSALFSAPAVAKPVSNDTLKSECKSAGGTWESVSDGHGGTQSSCVYHDIDGHKYIDYYKNGQYVGTDQP